MALSNNLQQLLSINDNQPVVEENKSYYNFVMYWRIGVMLISSGLLATNIIMIYKSKQYIYNTLKLFLFLQLFALLGQVIVLFRTIYNIAYDEKQENNGWCYFQAYLNLIFYNLSYLFALLITLYVRKVIDNTHKYFVRQHIKLILYVVIANLIVYLPPLILSFANDGHPYSMRPVGFQIMEHIFSGKPYPYVFYCGIGADKDSNIGITFSAINMFLIPLLMFIVHLALIQKNRKSMKFLRGLQQLNPRQWFILKSGTLSILVFLFQFFNFFKYILSLIRSDQQWLIITLGFLNMIFDFCPIILVLEYYRKYYKKGKKLQQKSLVRTTMTQSFNSKQIINY